MDRVRRELRVPAELRGKDLLPPIAVHATVAPPRGAAAEGAGAEDDATEDEGAIAFDPRVIRDEFVMTLEAASLFEAVFPVGQDLLRPDIYQAADEARRKGASLLIDVRVEPPSLRRTERSFVLPIVAWMFFGFPSFWFHNHKYALELDLSMRLYDLNTDRALPERPVVPGRAEGAFNFYERTSSIPVFLLTNVFPSPFCPIDEDKVAATLAPAALRTPLAQFLEHVAKAFRAEIYTFSIQKLLEGPSIEVHYPPAERPTYLLEREARLALTVAAPPGRTIREVRFGKEIVFPRLSAAANAPAPPRRMLPLETTEPVEAGVPLVLEVTDSDGRTSSCLIIAAPPREKAAASPQTGSATPPPTGTSLAEQEVGGGGGTPERAH